MFCKVIIASLAALALCHAAPAKDEKQTDKASVGVLNLCAQYGWPAGTYPHPYDCRKFISCSAARVTAELDCPLNTAFNPNTKVCDAYANVPICNYQNNFQPYVNNICNQYQYGNGVYYHPYDCNQYIQCYNYGTTVNTCPVGTVYDATQRACIGINGVAGAVGGVYNGNPYCNQYVFNPIQPVVNNVYDNYCGANGLANGIHPDPYSCVSYIQCTFGVTNHMPCPAGLSFDRNLLVCDDQRYNNCNANIYPGVVGKK